MAQSKLILWGLMLVVPLALGFFWNTPRTYVTIIDENFNGVTINNISSGGGSGKTYAGVSPIIVNNDQNTIKIDGNFVSLTILDANIISLNWGKVFGFDINVRIDNNSVGRFNSSVIANPPWGSGDTTLDTNSQARVNFLERDLNFGENGSNIHFWGNTTFHYNYDTIFSLENPPEATETIKPMLLNWDTNQDMPSFEFTYKGTTGQLIYGTINGSPRFVFTDGTANLQWIGLSAENLNLRGDSNALQFCFLDGNCTSNWNFSKLTDYNRDVSRNLLDKNLTSIVQKLFAGSNITISCTGANDKNELCTINSTGGGGSGIDTNFATTPDFNSRYTSWLDANRSYVHNATTNNIILGAIDINTTGKMKATSFGITGFSGFDEWIDENAGFLLLNGGGGIRLLVNGVGLFKITGTTMSPDVDKYTTLGTALLRFGGAFFGGDVNMGSANIIQANNIFAQKFRANSATGLELIEALGGNILANGGASLDAEFRLRTQRNASNQHTGIGIDPTNALYAYDYNRAKYVFKITNNHDITFPSNSDLNFDDGNANAIKTRYLFGNPTTSMIGNLLFSDSVSIQNDSDADSYLSVTSTGVQLNAQANIVFNSQTGVVQSNEDFLPDSNKARDIGSGSLVWDDVYADDFWTLGPVDFSSKDILSTIPQPKPKPTGSFDWQKQANARYGALSTELSPENLPKELTNYYVLLNDWENNTNPAWVLENIKNEQREINDKNETVTVLRDMNNSEIQEYITRYESKNKNPENMQPEEFAISTSELSSYNYAGLYQAIQTIKDLNQQVQSLKTENQALKNWQVKFCQLNTENPACKA